jgi:hypothetical protein
MACRFFDDARLARCTAVAGLLVPTHHERERYCRTDGEEACPTYRLYQLRGGPLSQDAYYALWLPPAPPLIDADDAEAPPPLPV